MDKILLDSYSSRLRNNITEFRYNTLLLENGLIYKALEGAIDNLLCDRIFPMGLINHIYRTFDNKIMREEKLKKSIDYLESVIDGVEMGVYTNLHYNISNSNRVPSGLYLFMKHIGDDLIYTFVNTSPLEGFYLFGDGFKQKTLIMPEGELKRILFDIGLSFLNQTIIIEREDF